MDRKILVNRILKLEKEMDENLKMIYEALDTSCSPEELLPLSQKYAIGDKYIEYSNMFLTAQKSYFSDIMLKLKKHQEDNKISKDTVVMCLGYLIGPSKKMQ